MLYGEALEILKSTAKLQIARTERMKALDAIGRVVSSNVVSTLTVPPFTNSAVDGFALKASMVEKATAAHPLRFKIAGTLYPGEKPPAQTPAGHVWEIMTGAPLPLDCDAAAKVEDTESARGTHGETFWVEIQTPLAQNESLRFAGEDFKPGTIMIEKGQRIRPEHMMGFATLGMNEIEVYQKPRVLLLATGKELVEPGDALEEGQIYNSTQSYLIHAMHDLGADVEVGPTMHDDPGVFSSYLDGVLRDPPDILITTGAVSMGKADFIRPGFEQKNAEVLFHRVNIRPGKPILFCRWDATTAARPFVAFGLPGNPVSSVVGTRFFIEPYLRTLMNRPSEKPFQAKLTNTVNKPSELKCFFKAQLTLQEGEARVEVLKGQPSFMIRPLLQSSAWAILPEGQSEFTAGSLIELAMLKNDA